MIQTPEPEPIIDETADLLAFVGGQVVPVERKGNQSDPIYELFNPPKTANPGWTIISTPSLYTGTCVTQGIHSNLAVVSFSFSFCMHPDTNRCLRHPALPRHGKYGCSCLGTWAPFQPHLVPYVCCWWPPRYICDGIYGEFLLSSNCFDRANQVIGTTVISTICMSNGPFTITSL